MIGPLTDIIRDYQAKLEAVVQASSEGVAHTMIDRAPVLSGSMVASMTGTVNGSGARNVSYPLPPEATSPMSRWNDPRAGAYRNQAKNRASRSARRMRIGDSYTFISAKPYTRRVEYDGWSYMKAPSGMRGVAVAQWQRIVNQEARRIRGN